MTHPCSITAGYFALEFQAFLRLTSEKLTGSDIFRPQTHRFGEIPVLYPQLADMKLGINCVRSVETNDLLLSKEYLD
jgi:hypothetical protein